MFILPSCAAGLFNSQVTLPDFLGDVEDVAKAHVDQCRVLLETMYATMDFTAREFQDRFLAVRYGTDADF